MMKELESHLDSSVSDTGVGRSKASRRKVTNGFHLVEGKQVHAMEDYLVAQFKNVNGREVGLFAIFDGHSGNNVASYLRNHLYDNILAEEHITSDPDVFVETIDEDADFIILASDGLWKVMSNQDAVDAVKDIRDAQEAAVELIEEAVKRKSIDDISCIVVHLH